MFYRAAVGFASVQTALTLFGKKGITHSSSIRFANRFLIWKLDLNTFENMYRLCLGSYQVIAVFDLKLMVEDFWKSRQPFELCVFVNFVIAKFD